MIGPSETQTFLERLSQNLDAIAAMLDECEFCHACGELIPENCKCQAEDYR